MTTVAVVFGVVALVSIGINIHLRMRLETEIRNNISTRADRDIFQNASASWNKSAKDWKMKFLKADSELEAAKSKLAKYDRKRDLITGKIIGRNSTK